MTELPVSSPRVTTAVSFLQDVVDEARVSNVAFMAGSIAYSAFLSLFPLLFLAILAASVLGGDLLVEYVLDGVASYLTPTGQELVVQTLTRATGRAQISIVSLVVFVWATLRVFRGLDVAFSILYDTANVRGLLDQLADGIVAVGALGTAVAGTVVISMVFARLPDVPFSGVLREFLLLAFLTVIFLPLYYIFPDADLSVREVLPGAVVAAVGWTALQAAFQVYVMFSATAALYGAIGGVILLVTWLYFAALVLLLGATVNVVLTRRWHATIES